jgi:sec-independent protein translocase protein TatA
MLSGLENPLHLLVVLFVVLLLFGAKRLPEMGASLGSGLREFKDGLTGSTRRLTPGDALANPLIEEEASERPVRAATPQ